MIFQEANDEANIFGNLAEKMELDGKLYHLKMSIGSCKIHNSQHIEHVSMCNDETESSTCVSDTK